jgi:23S rRNA (cytidine2498-2'-O)-methyltransferase
VRGLFVWFTDFGKAHVARSAFMNGPLRMADDDDAPSRSYLKVEESYGIIGSRRLELQCRETGGPGGGCRQRPAQGRRAPPSTDRPPPGRRIWIQSRKECRL